MARDYFITLLTVLTIIGCSKGNSTGSDDLPYMPYSVEDLVAGTGETVEPDSRLTIHYVAFVLGGDTVENTRTSSGFPVQIAMGIDSLIDGWKIGLLDMIEGGVRELTIPPELAYGEVGDSERNIPPNATIVYTIELLNVEHVEPIGSFEIYGVTDIDVKYEQTLPSGTMRTQKWTDGIGGGTIYVYQDRVELNCTFYYEYQSIAGGQVRRQDVNLTTTINLPSYRITVGNNTVTYYDGVYNIKASRS